MPLVFSLTDQNNQIVEEHPTKSGVFVIIKQAGILIIVLMLCCTFSVNAMTPPAWIGYGSECVYEASLSPYYDLASVPDDIWQRYGGTGVYGQWVDSVTGSDGSGRYQGYSTIYDFFSGNILVQQPWSYQPGDPGMGLFWVDLDQGFPAQNLIAQAPLDLAGYTWNARTYYFTSIGNSFDTKITIDADSGILLTKNEGLTGANGQMQRAVYILKSIK